MPVPATPRPTAVPSLPLGEVARLAGAAYAGAGDVGAGDAGAGDVGAGDVVVTGVTLDSRDVRPGDLYAALPGAQHHGAAFAAQAAAAGAVAVLTDATGAALVAGVPVLVVPEPRRVLGRVAAAVFGSPAERLLALGVTGTSGKTTTAYLLDAGLRAAGHRTGLVGTVETRIGNDVLPSSLTTPEAPQLQALLAVMVERGCTALAMEVSSHALALGRIDGTAYAVAAFTNLGRDHLDFHRDLEDYFQAKARLFTPERASRAVVCVDTEGGRRMAAVAAAQGLPVATVSATSQDADWRVADVAEAPDGTRFVVLPPAGADGLEASVALPGAYNIANALLAVATLAEAGVDPGVAVRGIAQVQVPGRMERVDDAGAGILGVVDYAHKPDAVIAALTAVRDAVPGRVLAVLGAGGDRDRDKRPLMGNAAARLADVVVVTDDNPRSEDAALIRAAVLAGAAEVPPPHRAEIAEVGDRAAAIRAAVAAARPGDVVIVLGKGHERGQTASGATLPFDDREELRAAFRELAVTMSRGDRS